MDWLTSEVITALTALVSAILGYFGGKARERKKNGL